MVSWSEIYPGCPFSILCVCQVEGVGSIQSLSQPLVIAWPGSVTTALLLWWTALRLPGKKHDVEFALSGFFPWVHSFFHLLKI